MSANFSCQRSFSALHPEWPAAGEGDRHMPAAPRRAGSALLTHTQSRLRALQRWLRSVPAEPDHAFSHSDIVPHFVQTDPTGHNHDAPDDPEVRMDHMSIAAGRSSLFPTTNVPPHVSVSGKWHNLSATQLGTSGACAMQERPGIPSPDHRHCVESLGRSGVGVPPSNTIILSAWSKTPLKWRLCRPVVRVSRRVETKKWLSRISYIIL